MYQQFDIYYYLQNVNQYLQQQNLTIKYLEETVKELQEEITQLKTKPSTNIEKIEYNFDQLKIETLEGTLNIGLTPNGTNQIEEFAVNQSTEVPHVLKKYPDLYPVLQDEVYRFLDQDGSNLITNVEQRYAIQLEPSYHQFIIDDVKKQIGERIYFYLNQYGDNSERNLSKEHIQEETFSCVQRDIENAIELFVKNIPNRGK